MINQSYLKECLHYDPDTGIFTRTISAGASKAGDPAGSDNGLGYIRLRVGKNRKIMAHVAAWLYMTGDLPNDEIDHINGNSKDNRWKNLRLTSSSINSRNQKVRKNNTSGVMGVSILPGGKWIARINTDAGRISLGRFNDWFDAVCARKSAENSHSYHSNHGRIA